MADVWLITDADDTRVVAKTMPLLHVRELLSSMAHLGNADGGAQRLRRILAPFYPR